MAVQSNDPKSDVQGPQQDAGPQFAIQRLYIKDLSLESPNSPKIFLESWEPQLNMDLGTQTSALGNDAHEVVLTVTVTVKIKESTAFLVETKQAGIFSLTGFPGDQLQRMLGSFCPNILYPYACSTVTDAVVRAGFPQLYLTPVNFDVLYDQHLQEQSKKSDNSDGSAGSGQIQ